ncbi:unnamed protein product [Chrysoparadoxa australica]
MVVYDGWIRLYPDFYVPFFSKSKLRYAVLDGGILLLYTGHQARHARLQPTEAIELGSTDTIHATASNDGPSLKLVTTGRTLVFRGEDDDAMACWLSYVDLVIRQLKLEVDPFSMPVSTAYAEKGGWGSPQRGGSDKYAVVHDERKMEDFTPEQQAAHRKAARRMPDAGAVKSWFSLSNFTLISGRHQHQQQQQQQEAEKNFSFIDRSRSNSCQSSQLEPAFDGGEDDYSGDGDSDASSVDLDSSDTDAETEQSRGVRGRSGVITRLLSGASAPTPKEKSSRAGSSAGETSRDSINSFKKILDPRRLQKLSLQITKARGKKRERAVAGQGKSARTNSAKARSRSLIRSQWSGMVTRLTALYIARTGEVYAVRRFLRLRPDYPLELEANMFRAAVRYRHLELVQYFLEERNIDVNICNDVGMPAVWFAALPLSKNDGGITLRYMVSRGANPHAVDQYGMSIMHALSAMKSAESIPMMKYLHEEYHVSLEVPDIHGSTPLHWAALHGIMDTVKWITETTFYFLRRANWNETLNDMAGVTILLRAEHFGAQRHWRVRGLLEAAENASPLGVAILFNHDEVARYLMGLGSAPDNCMQAMRNGLLDSSNKDLKLLARTWPKLLPQVLDSFCTLKREQWVFDCMSDGGGWLEKRYDMKMLYGLPGEVVSETPLSIILGTKYTNAFMSKSVRLVIALKWAVFGYRCYAFEIGLYLLLVTSFVSGFVIWNELDNDVPGGVFRILCWVILAWLVAMEGKECYYSTSLRAYFTSGWNVICIVAYALVLALLPVYMLARTERYSDPESQDRLDEVKRCIVGPATLMLFMRVLEHLATLRATGMFIAVIRLMILDTIRWSVLFVLFQAAFALAFFGLLEGEDGFNTFGATVITVFSMSMGELVSPFSSTTSLNVVASIVMITFSLLVSILYLNLLVAIMTTSYEEVLRAAGAQALMSRAEALLKWEGTMQYKERKKYYDKIAPAKGQRSHITLTDWGDAISHEVFIDSEEVRVMEPQTEEESDQCAEIREAISDLQRTARNNMQEMRSRMAAISQEMRKRSSRSQSFHHALTSTAAATSRALARPVTPVPVEVQSISTEKIDEWRRKSLQLAEKSNRRKALVLAQAYVRGFLARRRLEEGGAPPAFESLSST